MSFDMAFLCIMLDSAYEPDIEEKELRCMMHPMKPRLCHASENTAYAADMTIMLAYQKAIDDINDDRSAKARLLKGMLEKPYAAVCEKYPDKADIIEARLNELYAIEQRNRPGEDTDAASGCFGALLGKYSIRENSAQGLEASAKALAGSYILWTHGRMRRRIESAAGIIRLCRRNRSMRTRARC